MTSDPPPEPAPLQGPPQRAPVRPRARLHPHGEPLPLEDHIASLLTKPRRPVNLFGPQGAGKTTALRHLAATFSNQDLLLYDNFTLPLDDSLLQPHPRLLILATETPLPHVPVALELADWSQDDFIEYLLNTHRPQCKSVMQRLRDSTATLPAQPQIAAMLLDELAADESLPNLHAALKRLLARLLPTPEAYATASAACLNALLQPEANWHLHSHNLQPPSLRLREIATPLAAEKFAAQLLAADYQTLLKCPPRELLQQTAALLKTHPNDLAPLIHAISEQENLQPLGVTLLLALDPAWRPSTGKLSNLENANLQNAQWPDFDLQRCRLKHADLSNADLTRAVFGHAAAHGAIFRNALLPRANFRFAAAPRADFSAADLSLADLHAAYLTSAIFTRANLHGANLSQCKLINVMLDHANLVGAFLRGAHLDNANLENADFSAADLTGAALVNLNLRDAIFTHAIFQHATLLNCHLENLELPFANFASANLKHSDLTATILPHADFQNADLCRTGLANIHWEHADLQNADLRFASFHMGSSRSGLVHSDLASEGTRTGFYTDDYTDQTHKPPEEIRKANLRFANLTGANLEQTDFYLVDLRGAVYTETQKQHLTRCGAILHHH